MEIDFISPSFTSPLLDIFHSLQNNFHIKISTWYPVRADVKTFSQPYCLPESCDICQQWRLISIFSVRPQSYKRMWEVFHSGASWPDVFFYTSYVAAVTLRIQIYAEEQFVVKSAKILRSTHTQSPTISNRRLINTYLSIFSIVSFAITLF